MKTLAILDHYHHILIIDEVSDETLEKYNGEEDYINDNYKFKGDWSWDLIVGISNYSEDGENVKIKLKQ